MSHPQQTLVRNNKAYLFLTITACCWGLNVIFGKLAIGHISPMLLVTLRWLAVVLLLFIFAGKQISSEWPIIRKHLWFVCIMGAAGFTTFNALFYLAAYKTSAINIGILQGSIPVFVLLGSFLIYRMQISKIQTVGVILTLFGVIIVATGGELMQIMQLQLNIGDLFMVIACLLYAAYSVGLSKRPAISFLPLFAAMASVAFLVSLPLLAVESYLQSFAWPTTQGWIIAALVALLPSLIAQILFMQGVALIGPGRAGVFVNLVPVFASIMAVSLLNESVALFQLIALAFVLGGIALSEAGKPKI